MGKNKFKSVVIPVLLGTMPFFMNVIIPVLLGIMTFFMEYKLSKSDYISDITVLLGFFFISGILAMILLIIYKRFDVCGWFVLSNCGVILVLIYSHLFKYHRIVFNMDNVYITMKVWAGINLICFVAKLIDKDNKIGSFKNYFKLSSITLACTYIHLLLTLSFPSNENIGVTAISLKNIIYGLAQISANSHFTTIDSIYPILSILLFTPVGFYTNILGRKLHVLYRVLILSTIPIVMEIIQYITCRGIFNIGSIILNLSGGLLGMLVALALEKVYSLIRNDEGQKILEL
jgi:VanZ like family.